MVSGGVRPNPSFCPSSVRLAAFDEVDPVAEAVGSGEGGNEARVVDRETIIQRVIAYDGVSEGTLGKRGQHAGNGLFHAAVCRIAAHLRIGVKLERKEKVWHMGVVRSPESLGGTFSVGRNGSVRAQNSPRPCGWCSADDGSENAGAAARERWFPHNGQ